MERMLTTQPFDHEQFPQENSAVGAAFGDFRGLAVEAFREYELPETQSNRDSAVFQALGEVMLGFGTISLLGEQSGGVEHKELTPEEAELEERIRALEQFMVHSLGFSALEGATLANETLDPQQATPSAVEEFAFEAIMRGGM